MSIKRYTPDELYEKFRYAHDAVTPREFFNRPGHKKTQELWCAARFAQALSSYVAPCSVLVSDKDEQTDADFHLEASGGSFPFQITEVQVPGRRRGDEYKKQQSTGATLEDWDSSTEQGPGWVRDAIQKKSDRYGGDVSRLNLLVYANFPSYEHDYEKLRSISANAASKFASVWVLNGNGTCCIAGHVLGGPRPWTFNAQE
jgi:hypothetical protein